MTQRTPRDTDISIPVRRFANWRDLREFVVETTSDTPKDASLHFFPPGPGPAWVLERFLRDRLAGSRVPLPAVGSPGRLFGDLAAGLDPPFRPAPDITREVLMEHALAAGAGDPEAPGGDAVLSVETLARRLLAFLDEQAGDCAIAPGQSAFEGFVGRVVPRLTDAAETDEGAARLADLACWLGRAVARYRTALDEAARDDEDGLRRRLLADADTLRPLLRNHRGVALGADALPPADIELLLALLPPGALSWALVEGAEEPLLPRGSTLVAETARSRPPSLFDRPPAAARSGPVVLRPASPAESGSLVFAVTDREQEAQLAADLLAEKATERPDVPGRSVPRVARRCAIATRTPRVYLGATGEALARRGFAIETRFRPDLADAPWTAAVADALEFAARPGRLTVGLRLLRNPFFEDPDLPVPPPRAADLLEKALADVDARNTNLPEALPGIVRRLRREAEIRERRCREHPSDRRRFFWGRRAAELRVAADILAQLDAIARELDAIRSPGTGFADALQTLLAFLDRHFTPPDDERLRETIQTVLAQAATAAPPGMAAGDGDVFTRRVRRLLAGRPLPPEKGSATKNPRVSLIAAEDAPWGEWDGLVLVGLCDADWPGRRPANVFFPARLLEKATRKRQQRRRDADIELLRTIPTLPRRFAAFTRPHTDDSFPASVSPFEADLTETARGLRGERFAQRPEEVAPASGGLPRELDRSAPSARVLDRPVSPTAMDEYLRSPAQFFGKRVLWLAEERPPSDLPPPTQRGNWLHLFLEDAFRALRQSDRTVTAESLPVLLAWFRARFAAFCQTTEGPKGTHAVVEERWLFGTDTTPGALEWYLREEAARGPATPCAFEEVVSGEIEPGSDELPPLRIRGTLDRRDEMADGSFRIVEYKSGRSWKKPAQGRLYARLVATRHGRPATYAIPYFGSREWVGPDDKPNDAEQDEAIRAAHTGLAIGDFPAPVPDPKGGGKFDFPLIVRDDLPDPEPQPRRGADGDKTAGNSP